MFGRFGFNEAHAAARSFFFFSASTEFVHTAFVGPMRPWREEVSADDRFRRQLQKGVNFDGIDTLESMLGFGGTRPDEGRMFRAFRRE
jgi:hypothetical protein